VIQADWIRTFVRDNCIEPARARGDGFISIRTGDVHKAMKLKNKMPAVCAALKARKFEPFAGVQLVKAEGPHQGSNLYLTFRILRQGEEHWHPPTAPTPLLPPRGGSRRLRRMEERCERLVAGFDGYIHQFEMAKPFTGPSLYFHLRTIQVLRKHRRPSDALDDHEWWELLYATLTSWGMHRMGDTWTKLRDLPDIVASFLSQRNTIERVQELRLSNLARSEVPQVASTLWGIMDHLEVGLQDTKLVVNSKALHHLLPDLMPPIDRQYSLKFFYNNTNMNRAEGILLGEVYAQFHRIAQAVAPKFASLLGCDMHTSETKIIDNAIVGYVLAELKQRTSARTEE
jgi:hypothetical protein